MFYRQVVHRDIGQIKAGKRVDKGINFKFFFLERKRRKY